MTRFLKTTSAALALLLAGTSLSMALGIETLQDRPAPASQTTILVADDDDDFPFWLRNTGPRWDFDRDDRDDDRWDDDDDDDDDRWDDDDDDDDD